MLSRQTTCFTQVLRGQERRRADFRRSAPTHSDWAVAALLVTLGLVGCSSSGSEGGAATGGAGSALFPSTGGTGPAATGGMGAATGGGDATVTGGTGSTPTGGTGTTPTGGTGTAPTGGTGTALTGGTGDIVTGGSSEVATGGAIEPATGGAADPGTGGTTEQVDPGGSYITTGPWQGYPWTGAAGDETTISPEDFADATGLPLCASGSVGPMEDYSGVGMLGLNINQAPGEDTPLETWTPTTEEGVLVNISNPGDSPIRIQIQGPNGEEDPADRWCASVGEFDTDVQIAWGSFNTECWSNEGDYYEGQPLTGVLVLVPGDNAEAVPFDFCLNSVGVYGDGGTPVDTGLVGQGVLAEQYASSHVQRDGRDYIVQNNVWGSDGSQTVNYLGTTFEVTSVTGSGNTSGAPLSYPSVFIGSNNDRATEGSNLPIAVSAIESVQTSWTWSDTGVSGEYNAAYDVWFSTSSGGENDAAMLMVWFYDPPVANPAGNEVGTATVEGANYTVWRSTNNVISYVGEKTYSMTFDLNSFIQDAVAKGYIQSSWYLTNVFAGFEIWSGGSGLATTDFYAIVK